jgi:hypothetical protein
MQRVSYTRAQPLEFILGKLSSFNVRDKRVLQTSECSKNPSTYTIALQSDISQQPNMPESSNEAYIILALQALQNDLKLSLRKAAAMYHVDRFALSRRRQGIFLKRVTHRVTVIF